MVNNAVNQASINLESFFQEPKTFAENSLPTWGAKQANIRFSAVQKTRNA
jgi:hypothetical protein